MDSPIHLDGKTLEKLRNLIVDGIKDRSAREVVKFFEQIGVKEDPKNPYAMACPHSYTDHALEEINNTPDMEECLKNLFDIRDFLDQLSMLDRHIEEFNKYLIFDGLKITREGQHIHINESSDAPSIGEANNDDEDQSLNAEFSQIPVEDLGFDSAVMDIIRKRIHEIENCFKGGAYFSAVIMIGSALEGILIGYFMQNSEEIKSSIKKVEEMKLAELLQVARDNGLIREDTFQFGRAVKDFRNYIHPSRQLKEGFTPNEDTAEISLKVLVATINEIAKKRKNQ